MSKVKSGRISSVENVGSSDFNVTNSDLPSAHR